MLWPLVQDLALQHVPGQANKLGTGAQARLWGLWGGGPQARWAPLAYAGPLTLPFPPRSAPLAPPAPRPVLAFDQSDRALLFVRMSP